MTEPTYLYKHFGTDGTLLYVGITDRPKDRRAAHLRRSKWAHLIARVEEQIFTDRTDAACEELRVIMTEKPPYNKVPGAGRVRKTDKVVMISFRTTEAVEAQIKALCRKRRVNRTQLLHQLLENC